jgi:hypothetical protein
MGKFIKSFILFENLQAAKSLIKDKPEYEKQLEEVKELCSKNNCMNYCYLFISFIVNDGLSVEGVERILDKIIELKKLNVVNRLPKNVVDYVKDGYEKLEDDITQVYRKYEATRIYNELPALLKKQINVLSVKKKADLIDLFSAFYKLEDKDTLIKKISSFKTVDQLESAITNFVKKRSGNLDFENFVNKLEEDKEVSVEFVDYEKEQIIASILTYEASRRYGSDAWCISRHDSYFNNYVKNIFYKQYFIWNFLLPINDPHFQVGITINDRNSITAAHDKRDHGLNRDKFSKETGINLKMLKSYTLEEVKKIMPLERILEYSFEYDSMKESLLNRLLNGSHNDTVRGLYKNNFLVYLRNDFDLLKEFFKHKNSYFDLPYGIKLTPKEEEKILELIDIQVNIDNNKLHSLYNVIKELSDVSAYKVYKKYDISYEFEHKILSYMLSNNLYKEASEFLKDKKPNYGFHTTSIDAYRFLLKDVNIKFTNDSDKGHVQRSFNDFNYIIFNELKKNSHLFDSDFKNNFKNFFNTYISNDLAVCVRMFERVLETLNMDIIKYIVEDCLEPNKIDLISKPYYMQYDLGRTLYTSCYILNVVDFYEKNPLRECRNKVEILKYLVSKGNKITFDDILFATRYNYYVTAKKKIVLDYLKKFISKKVIKERWQEILDFYKHRTPSMVRKLQEYLL